MLLDRALGQEDVANSECSMHSSRANIDMHSEALPFMPFIGKKKIGMKNSGKDLRTKIVSLYDISKALCRLRMLAALIWVERLVNGFFVNLKKIVFKNK